MPATHQSGTKPEDKDGYVTVFMPLYENVRNPIDTSWKQTTCPVCQRLCWMNPLEEEGRAIFGKRIRYRCTRCAMEGK